MKTKHFNEYTQNLANVHPKLKSFSTAELIEQLCTNFYILELADDNGEEDCILTKPQAIQMFLMYANDYRGPLKSIVNSAVLKVLSQPFDRPFDLATHLKRELKALSLAV